MPTYKITFVKTFRLQELVTVTAPNEEMACKAAHDLIVTDDIYLDDMDLYFDDVDLISAYEDHGANDEEWLRQSAETIRGLPSK